MVTFSGLQAHAASEPWMGRNALDALVLLFTSIGLWRQQLPGHARVHGIVVEGGTAANIIPDRAVGRFMIRSNDQAYYESMHARFQALCDAAALATDTTVEVDFSGGSSTMKDNAILRERFVANLASYGIADNPVDLAHLGSSDMGNVSQVLPTIHPSIAICEHGVPGHSILFRDAAATPWADEVTLIAATVVAQVAYELFSDPALVAAGAARRGLERVPRGLRRRTESARAGGIIADDAPRWTSDANRRRPLETDRTPARRSPAGAPSPGGHPCPIARFQPTAAARPRSTTQP